MNAELLATTPCELGLREQRAGMPEIEDPLDVILATESASVSTESPENRAMIPAVYKRNNAREAYCSGFDEGLRVIVVCRVNEEGRVRAPEFGIDGGKRTQAHPIIGFRTSELHEYSRSGSR